MNFYYLINIDESYLISSAAHPFGTWEVKPQNLNFLVLKNSTLKYFSEI